MVWNIIYLFFHILGIVTPTDFHIFSEGLKPPTRLCVMIYAYDTYFLFSSRWYWLLHTWWWCTPVRMHHFPSGHWFLGWRHLIQRGVFLAAIRGSKTTLQFSVQCCWNWHKPCSKPESVAAVGRNKRSLHQHLLVSTLWLKLSTVLLTGPCLRAVVAA